MDDGSTRLALNGQTRIPGKAMCSPATSRMACHLISVATIFPRTSALVEHTWSFTQFSPKLATSYSDGLKEPFSGDKIMTDESVSLTVSSVKPLAEAIRNNVARVIVGKLDVIDLLLTTLLSDGHVLIEDVPGMGKTIMAKALARSLGASFQRVQGTPDLLPTDIIGVSYFDQRHNEFVFRQGPLCAELFLVDEINRATPRTQSAFLEAMPELQVTVERSTMPLQKPFLVSATH